METLTFEDMRTLSGCIHAIYSLRDPEAFGQRSLAILEQLVATEASVLLRTTPSLTKPQYQFNTPDFERLFTPEFKSQCEQTASEHPLFEHASAILNGGAHAISDVIRLPELQQTEGYQQITEVIGIEDQILLVLFDHSPAVPYPEGQLAYYTLYQPWDRFTERDRLLLNLFQSHLNQAFQNALHCQQQQQAIAQLQQTIEQSGIVFLDPMGTVLWITAQAERWLQHYLPSARTNRQLPERVQSWVNEQITQLNTEHDVPAVCVPLRFKQGDRQLVMRLVKDQNQENYLLLLAEERLLSIHTTLQRLGLSPREAQILTAIMHGRDPKAIANALQIRPATVRKHLENIYRKLHVQSQMEAVALVSERMGTNFEV